MYFEDATRKQLLTIALHEDCDIEYKYQAAHELQVRKWNDDCLPQLVSLWGRGYSLFQIAIEMELPETTIKSQIQKYGLYRKRVS